jgi:hypothetical protein
MGNSCARENSRARSGAIKKSLSHPPSLAGVPGSFAVPLADEMKFIFWRKSGVFGGVSYIYVRNCLKVTMFGGC